MSGKRFLVFLLVLLMAQPILAQTPPGRWERLDRQDPGTILTVTLKTGMILYGTLKATGDQNFTLETDGGPVIVAKSDVQKILTRSRGDSVKDGVLVGLVGGTIAAVIPAMLARQYAGNEGASGAAAVSTVVLLGAAIGSLSGFLADKVKKGDVLLYQAVAP